MVLDVLKQTEEFIQEANKKQIFEKALGVYLKDYFAIETVEKVDKIEDTEAYVHCYFLKQKPNVDSTENIRNFLETCSFELSNYIIPKKRRDRADKSDNSSREHARLNSEAKKTFVDYHKMKDKALNGYNWGDDKKSGEFGELLLFLLAEQVLKLPQLMSKMSLKTNERDHIKGVDGIHIGLTKDNKLALYYGESKIYKSKSDAVSDALSGISVHLKSPAKRELSLITDNLNSAINNPELEDKLLGFFDYHDPMSNDYTEIRGLCLVGFESKRTFKQDNEEYIVNAISRHINTWLADFKSQININGLEGIHMHVFFVPFKDVDLLRDEFMKGLYSL